MSNYVPVEYIDWIPVETRNPKQTGTYLVCVENKIGTRWVTPWRYNADGFEPHWDRLGEYKRLNITHWMPIPRPPKKEQKKGKKNGKDLRIKR